MNDLPHQADVPPDKPPRSVSATTPSTNPQLIGERVHSARLAANMTQQELAGTTYSKSYISAVERGKMTPSFKALALLAERLGVTLTFLIGEEPIKEIQKIPEAPLVDEAQMARLSEAERLLQQGRYEEAIGLFEQTGEKDKICWAHEQYAQFLAEQGRYQEAYEQMRLALQR